MSLVRSKELEGWWSWNIGRLRMQLETAGGMHLERRRSRFKLIKPCASLTLGKNVMEADGPWVVVVVEILGK